MTKTYTVTLTDAEDLSLSWVALSQQDWINSVVHERCRIAMDEIVAICVDQCLKNNIAIPASKEAMVELAFKQGWIKSGVEINNQNQLNTE